MPEPRELPTFEGYTVDARLRQFRKAEYSPTRSTMEFIDFDTPEGGRLLKRFLASASKAVLTQYFEAYVRRPGDVQ